MRATHVCVWALLWPPSRDAQLSPPAVPGGGVARPRSPEEPHAELLPPGAGVLSGRGRPQRRRSRAWTHRTGAVTARWGCARREGRGPAAASRGRPRTGLAARGPGPTRVHGPGRDVRTDPAAVGRGERGPQQPAAPPVPGKAASGQTLARAAAWTVSPDPASAPGAPRGPGRTGPHPCTQRPVQPPCKRKPITDRMTDTGPRALAVVRQQPHVAGRDGTGREVAHCGPSGGCCEDVGPGR